MPSRSKRPKSAEGIGRGKTALKWTCTFEYKDKEGVSRKGKGRTFDLPEIGATDLFPTGVLCAILHRSRKTIYGWEENFGWPPALYHLEEDARRKRWYSRKQLVAVLTAYECFGRLRGKNYNRLKEFIATVREIWYIVDQPANIPVGQ